MKNYHLTILMADFVRGYICPYEHTGKYYLKCNRIKKNFDTYEEAFKAAEELIEKNKDKVSITTPTGMRKITLSKERIVFKYL